MNIRQIKIEIQKILIDAGIEQNEAEVEAKMLIKHYFEFSDVDLLVKEQQELDLKMYKLVVEKAKLRADKRIPIQHVIGQAYFMGEDFIVNEHVLIPRDETEILVRRAIEVVNQNNFKTVLDIGTGSGCISCMVAKLTNAQVLGVDISTDALSTALDNSSKLGLFNKAVFRKSDIFSNIKEDENFDVIISNPPYIPSLERENLQVEVGFEPEGALFAKDELGIDFYEKITNQSMKFLNEGGYLMFELGQGQATYVEAIMKKNGFKNIEIIQDLAYIKRVILGKK